MVIIGQEGGVRRFPVRKARRDFDHAFLHTKAARYAIVLSFPYTLRKF